MRVREALGVACAGLTTTMLMATLAVPADAATARREAAGTLVDCTAVEAVKLNAANGV